MTPEQYQSIIEREFATNPEITAYCAHTRALADIAIEAGISPLIQNQYDQERFDQYGARISIASNIANYWHGSHCGALCTLSRQSTMSDAIREIAEQDRYRYLADKIDTADFPLPYTRYWNSASDEQKLERIELYFRADGHFDQYHKITRNQLAELRHRADIARAIGIDPIVVDLINRRADRLESAWNAHLSYWRSERETLSAEIAEKPFAIARTVRPIDTSARFDKKQFYSMLPSDSQFIGNGAFFLKRNAIKPADEKRMQAEFSESRVVTLKRAAEIWGEACENRESARLIGEYDSDGETYVAIELLNNAGKILVFDPKKFGYLWRITRADSVFVSSIGMLPVCIFSRNGERIGLLAAMCENQFPAPFDIPTAIEHLESLTSSPV